MSKKNVVSDPKLIRSLQRYEKQSRRLAYNELPNNVNLEAEKWDLSSWTLIMSDNCLSRLVERQNAHIVTDLDLSGGDKITDAGLNVITDNLPNLTSFSIENAFQITEKGLAALVKSCHFLKKLSLSGCLGISGTEFAILGQHACNLVHLEVSGCRQITSWAFMKIFEGCQLLKYLDVSHCSSITDQGVKVLANFCTNLERLNLQECRQISDVGILSLSKKATNLSMITLSRKDLVSRITDVSLLAIAEGCSNLKFIDISGCEMITDVGISWLAKGCKYIEYVNLSNCTKITNVGLRYLSEECRALRTAILKNVKQVSDVGLRFLANGCAHLECINASGLCLLTDGVQRDFGHEGLQSLANSSSKTSVKKLNLHGCFHISKYSIKALSSMKTLEVLVLSSCKTLSSEAVTILFESCVHISMLSLAKCGECICDTMLESIGTNLRNLKVLDITDSVKVGRKGLKSLSRCTSLVSLNLSGCKRVSNEAILGLGEGHFKPGIRELYLNHCVRLDDTALTWIADSFKDRTLSSGSVTLITLALKGTKVTHRALVAVQSYFQYSAIKKNTVYFGFLALSRAQDRRTINDHSRKAHSVALIQATMRARRCRLIVSKARERHRKSQKVTIIAAYWRGWLARSLARKYRRERWCRRLAAVRLQCFIRAVLARITTTKLLYRRWRIKAPIMATIIQKIFRGYRGRNFALEIKIREEEALLQRQCVCIKIQSIIRMNIAIEKRGVLREEVAILERRRLRACVRIQNLWRSELARQTLNKMRLYQFIVRKKEIKASRCIIGMIRHRMFTSCIHEKVLHKRWLHDIARKIQRWYREKVAEALRITTLRNDASINIQLFVRRWLARLRLYQLRITRDNVKALQAKKAVVITCWYRKQLARMTIFRLRKERNEKLKQLFITQSEAAVQIEAFWRGCLGRKISQHKLEKSKSSWKQMWSEEDKDYFYYNLTTGESRWGKPQELLDLEPRPICSNCSFWDAQVECSNCDEYFCKACWDAVHYGGKRKTHKFRTIYDFYQRRIEPNGDFPSLWPSELEHTNYG